MSGGIWQGGLHWHELRLGVEQLRVDGCGRQGGGGITQQADRDAGLLRLLQVSGMHCAGSGTCLLGAYCGYKGEAYTRREVGAIHDLRNVLRPS